ELAKMQPRPYRHWSDAGRWVDLSPRVESERYGNRPRHVDSAAVRTGLSLHRRYPELPAGCERNESDNICQESCLFSSITPLAEINWEWLWLRSTTRAFSQAISEQEQLDRRASKTRVRTPAVVQHRRRGSR